MAKRKANSPVVIDKAKFLLPKMEFFEVGATGEGFYFKELGGEALLEYKEFIEQLQKSAGETSELQPYQAVELMARFIVLSACDESGHQIFDESDLPALMQKEPNLLLEMANFAMPLSGLSPKAIGEVAVDLPNDLPSSSSTDLHTNSTSQ